MELVLILDETQLTVNVILCFPFIIQEGTACKLNLYHARAGTLYGLPGIATFDLNVNIIFSRVSSRKAANLSRAITSPYFDA